MGFDVEERLGEGLRYTEELDPKAWRSPCRSCCLRLDGSEEPVSSLRLYAYQMRFGAVAVPVEGYGGVQTLPEHRGKGYVRTLLERSLSGVARRADAVFLYGIEKLYPKFGFISCLPETSLSMRILAAEAASAPGIQLAPAAAADVPAIYALHNAEHRIRPWTTVRSEEAAARLAQGHVWRPGPEALVARRGGEIRGYVLLAGSSYGDIPRTFSVLEMGAAEDRDAVALLGAVARSCWERRIDCFSIAEPPDGTVGIAARRLGCEVNRSFPADGNGMGRILNRSSLLSRLAPELARRELCIERDEILTTAQGLTLGGQSRAGFRALLDGTLLPDDGALLRLLMGFWSARDAAQAGVPLPAEHRRAIARWFPGPSPQLPAPHSHRIDRY